MSRMPSFPVLLCLASAIVFIAGVPLIIFDAPWDDRGPPTEFTAGRVEDFATSSATQFDDYGIWLVRLPSGDFVAVDDVAQPSLCRVLRRTDSDFMGQAAWFVDACDGLVYSPTGQFAGDPSGGCSRRMNYPCAYAYLFRHPVRVTDGDVIVSREVIPRPYVPYPPPPGSVSGNPPPTQRPGSTRLAPLTPGAEVGFGIPDPSNPKIFPALRIESVDFDRQQIDLALFGPYSGPLSGDLKIVDEQDSPCSEQVTSQAGESSVKLSAADKLTFTVQYACEKGRAPKSVGLFGIIFERP